MTPLVRSLHYKKIVDVVPNHGRCPLHGKSVKILGVVKSGMISLIVVQQGAAGCRLSWIFPVQVMEATERSIAPVIDNFDHIDLRGPFSVLRVKPKGRPHTPPTGHLHATFKISIFPSPFGSQHPALDLARLWTSGQTSYHRQSAALKYMIGVIAIALPFIVKKIQATTI